jgi:hypothetical protein
MIGTDHYAFALYIFALLCVTLLLIKLLFSGTKTQMKLLEEKQAELLRLYRMVEGAIEEYYDQVNESKDEIRNLGRLHLPEQIQPSKPLQSALHFPAPEKSPPSPEVIPLFQHVVDELVSDDPLVTQQQDGENRRANILRLLDKNLDKTQIAKQLGVTVTEVEIIADLRADSRSMSHIS